MKEELVNREIDRITNLLQEEQVDLGLDEARSLVKRYSNSISALGFLANVEEQVGDIENAEAAYLACIAMQPESALGYLHLGFLYANRTESNLDMSDLAISCFSFVLDKSPDWFFYSRNFNFSDLMKRKLNLAARTLIKHYSSLHSNAVGDDEIVSRVSEAIWPRTHLRTFEYREAYQKPHLFYMPSLRAEPFWQVEDFAWVEYLKSNFKDIKTEFIAAQSSLNKSIRPYLGSHFANNYDLRELAGKQNWTALDLFKDGMLTPHASKSFPKTLKVLESLPLCGKGTEPDEVFFSILQPGQKIPPHYGLSNHSLTVHLGIKVPSSCNLTVNGIENQWEEGEVVVFDDSYMHEAENLSDETRVVLLFSVWHPSLSALEIEAIKRTFTARHDWLEARKLPLDREG